LIRAIAPVLRLVPDVRFVIAGSGTAEARLRTLAATLGVDEALTWTGWLPGIDEVLAAGDVYVNTSPDEGFGMATVEAMAFGLPVVVTTSAASAELVQGGAGAAIPPDDPGLLAQAICELLTDRSLAERIAREARVAAQRYSIQATASLTLNFYQQLCGEPVSRRPRAGHRTCSN